MATQTRQRTISPNTRASGSNRYKIDTKNVLSGDTLIVHIDHATKSFHEQYTFSGREVGPKKSISFNVNEDGTNIEINWSGATPIVGGSAKSMVIEKPAIEPKPMEKLSSDGVIKSLEPIVTQHTKVLVLGTMPGAESLRQQAYYSHPRNLFWKLIADVTKQEIPSTYDERKSFLLKNNIGLWDICQSCIREGSLDENISKESPSDLKNLLSEYPNIKCLAFNGQKAHKLYSKHFGTLPSVQVLSLPSSSPANAGISWEDKAESWNMINEIIN